VDLSSDRLLMNEFTGHSVYRNITIKAARTRAKKAHVLRFVHRSRILVASISFAPLKCMLLYLKQVLKADSN
jgi:hypothetical protein